MGDRSCLADQPDPATSPGPLTRVITTLDKAAQSPEVVPLRREESTGRHDRLSRLAPSRCELACWRPPPYSAAFVYFHVQVECSFWPCVLCRMPVAVRT